MIAEVEQKNGVEKIFVMLVEIVYTVVGMMSVITLELEFIDGKFIIMSKYDLVSYICDLCETETIWTKRNLPPGWRLLEDGNVVCQECAEKVR